MTEKLTITTEGVDDIRGPDIFAPQNPCYRSFENYLLPAPLFAQLTEQQQTRLAVSDNAASYLTEKQREIQEKLVALQESIGKVEGSLVLDDKGKPHLPPLDKAVPEDIERLQRRLYAMLLHVPLPDLLLEVENWTGYLKHYTHLTSGDAPVGTQKLKLVAALIGMGMYLGLGKMAESCPYTYRQLSWSVDWHIREETLLAALRAAASCTKGCPAG